MKKKKYSESFKKKFNTDECLKNLVSFNNFIDDHEGLIVPPYFYNFRNLFYKKNIFYTEHHDGNLSMGNIKFFSIFNERMNSLLNVNYLDLPPKIVAPYYVEIEDMNQYHKVFDEYLAWAKSEGKKLGSGRHMVELIVLRKYLSLEKTKLTIELAEQAVENGQKVIIFTNFTHSFDYLMNHFGGLAVGHNGKMNANSKQNSIDRFQEDDNVKVFVGNLISAGTAITLTKAETVIMNDLDFVPSNHSQAEDRAHRIGSTSTTNVYYPIAVGTIDEMMFKILEKKRKIIDTVIGDEHVSMDIENDLFGELLSGYF